MRLSRISGDSNRNLIWLVLVVFCGLLDLSLIPSMRFHQQLILFCIHLSLAKSEVKFHNEHVLDFLINSMLSAMVEPAVPTKPREAQLQMVSSR